MDMKRFFTSKPLPLDENALFWWRNVKEEKYQPPPGSKLDQKICDGVMKVPDFYIRPGDKEHITKVEVQDLWLCTNPVLFTKTLEAMIEKRGGRFPFAGYATWIQKTGFIDSCVESYKNMEGYQEWYNEYVVPKPARTFIVTEGKRKIQNDEVLETPPKKIKDDSTKMDEDSSYFVNQDHFFGDFGNVKRDEQ